MVNTVSLIRSSNVLPDCPMMIPAKTRQNTGQKTAKKYQRFSAEDIACFSFFI